MTDKRYYYDDPLAAAWMAKHFGMMFIARADTNLSMTPHWGIWLKDYDLVCVPDSYTEGKSGIRFYIHPDSLSILEPMIGDLVSEDASLEDCALISKYLWECGEEYDLDPGHFFQFIITREDFCLDCSYKIIQRKGTPFHWPKVEA